MRNPPIDWIDLIALGVDNAAIVEFDGAQYRISPSPPRLASQLCAALVSRPAPEGDRIAYLRHVRDVLIGLTDWTQAADSPLGEPQRAAWAAYRQSLRDLPQTYSGVGPIPWPAAP